MTATESVLELAGEDDISQSFVALNLPPKRIYKSDRFIPARSAMDFDYCHHMVTNRTKPTASNGTNLTGDLFVSHSQLLAANLLYNSPSYTQPRSLLAIRASAVHGNQLLDDASHTVRIPCPVILPLQPASKMRTPPSPPCNSQSFTSVLDAPGLRDDYYLNLIAWGTNGVVAIALGQSVYLYTTITRKIQKLRACSHQVDYVTSVAWLGSTSSTGNRLLAVGTLLAELQIWDVETCTKVRWMRSHNDRINSLSWSGHGTLATGSRDAVIHLHDVRCVRHVMAKLAYHREEVCGLAWSPDGGTLASGSNDKYLCFWDRAMVRSNGPENPSSPRSAHLRHYAAVRALAWSPWERHVLASGGGAADGTIKLWDASTGRLQCSVSTGSQICALVWSTSTPELVSAHGLGSLANQITLWDHATMEQVRHLTGHSARVLHLALSPNGSSVASAGADETLRFWDVFPGSQSTWTPRSSGLFGMPAAVIR